MLSSRPQQQRCPYEDGRLELSGRDSGGGSHPLHHGGEDLAHHPLHLPHAGAGRGGRGRVER